MFERTSEILVFGPFRFEPGNGLWRQTEEVALPPRSPDGRWVAYLAKTAGEWQVAVVAAAGGSPHAVFPARQIAEGEAARATAGHELRIVLAWFAELAQRMRGPA